jgi:hypothetical protein
MTFVRSWNYRPALGQRLAVAGGRSRIVSDRRVLHNQEASKGR